jgi:protein-S-isoprenylcysteine O-methyltransferase Ste14
MNLFLNALSKFAIGLVLVGLLLFLPAGTFAYFGGWLFIGLLFIPMLFLGAVLLLKAPDLLKKRLNHKEKEKTQQGVVAMSALLFLGGFICAGLDHRFGWTEVPFPAVIAASVAWLVGYGMYAEVMRENAYLSRTVEVQDGQKVIDTGLYGVVRHPMYLATILLFLSIPLVLESWISLLFFAFYPVVIVIRILNEEKVLTENLEGYSRYKEKVKYRLLPYIW